MSVEQDWSASRIDNHKKKLSHNSEENPKPGHNHRSSERGKAGMFDLNQVLLDYFFPA